MNPRALVGAAVAAACWAPCAFAQWTPPIGIPAPSFGINEAAPPRPNPWLSQVPGYYYVDRTVGAATDTNNQYGTPARPRRTIPLSLPAGSTVELHGTYTQVHSSPDQIVSNGTAAAPVFIRGETSANRPRITLTMEVQGSYAIFENLEFAFTDEEGLSLVAPMDHVAVRGCDIHGNLNGGGLSVQSFTSAINHDVVVYANKIHDNGDVNASFDQDVHGIAVSARVHHLWIVDNELYRNSGDGMQFNAGSQANQATLHHVYVGRNVSHNNKQAGYAVKQATDVIYSQNVAYSHRPGNSSPGAGFNYQYAPERIWTLFNTVTDSDFGWYIGNDNGLGNGQNMYWVGNVVYNIHSSGGFQSGSAYGNSAFMLAGGTNRYLVNNTMYSVDGGIFCPSDQGRVVMSNNVISTLSQSGGSHVFVEMPGTAQLSSMRNTLFNGTARIKWGGNSPIYTHTNMPGGCAGCKSGDPLFVDAANANFNIPPTSPAADAGIVDSIYATFQGLYGISIAVDAGGTPRPFGPAWDMGAFEYAVAGVSVGDASVGEGDTAGVALTFPVVLNRSPSETVTVSYATSNGTALAGSDYTAASGTVTFPPGATSRTVSATVLPDLVDEDDETLTVTLSNPVATTIIDGTATGTIVDNDPAPTISTGDCASLEGNAGTTPCTFPLTLSNPSSRSITLSYATSSGTATSGSDFQAASGTVTFPPLSLGPQNVSVALVGDTAIEEDEDFRLTLSNPVQGVIGNSQADGIVQDDDAVALSQDELVHGWAQYGSLQADPGPAAHQDYFRWSQPARSSFEVVVDGTSGDITPGLLLERLGPDNTTILQSGAVTGTGSSVTLRWQNSTAATVKQQHLRVRTGAAGCGSSCGPTATYRVRAWDTTLRGPRFNNFNQNTVVLLQNLRSTAVSGTAYFWAPNGTLYLAQPFTIQGRGILPMITTTFPALQGKSGTLTVAHNAGYGGLVGKAVSSDPVNGYAFDASLLSKP